MTTIMRGGTLLRSYISEFLQAALPPAIDAARGQWNVDSDHLPYPGKYDTIDPTAIGNNEYPGVGAVVLNDRNWVREEVDALAQQVYSATWAVRLVIVARTPHNDEGEFFTPEKETAVDLRDNLVSLVKAVILQTPSLGRPDEIRVEETALTSDYLEPFQANTQSKRWIAAALINTEIHFTERTYATKIGDTDEMIVQVENIGPLEELP